MVFLVEQGRPLDEVIFADTGGELPETYEYLKLASSYLEKHGIRFRTVVSRGGFLYERCKRRRVIPSQIWRWCTRDFKILPIYAHYRSLGGHIIQYLGISYEERDRTRESGAPYVTNRFPLVSRRMNRDRCCRSYHRSRIEAPSEERMLLLPFQFNFKVGGNIQIQ